MKNIRFESIVKTRGRDVVLNNISLEIEGGKFFALLGPSGCGKTTLLRLLAGLERPDSGRIYLGSEDITDLPPYKRKVHTVFQQYALFPHLSVFDNVAYSLHVRGCDHSEVADRVNAVLKVVQLTQFGQKSATQLSGGQQQRVALARALVSEPEVLLLDEPLAALDMHLKEKVLVELIDLQVKLGTTFVYVTHDQFEALTIADVMGIMNTGGLIEQLGTAEEIYEFPQSRFVAQFVGTTNIFTAVAHLGAADQESAFLEVPGLTSFELVQSTLPSWVHDTGTVYVSIRPEKIDIYLTRQEGFSHVLPGTVLSVIYYGRSTQYHVRLNNEQEITVFEQNEEHFPKESIEVGDSVFIHFQKENTVLLES